MIFPKAGTISFKLLWQKITQVSIIFYNFLAELEKEQVDSEVMLWQLDLGQRMRKGQDPKRRKREDRIFAIAGEYNQYVTNNKVSKYLKLIVHNL